MMLDEKTKVFLLLDEAEKRQKTAEQQQAALKDLLQASKTAGNALDKAIAALPGTVQRAVDSTVPNAMATAMSRAAQTAVQALEKATAGPIERLNQAVTRAERVTSNIEQASRKITWQWILDIIGNLILNTKICSALYPLQTPLSAAKNYRKLTSLSLSKGSKQLKPNCCISSLDNFSTAYGFLSTK